ncbi:hypothetical protein FB446DRAFT_645782 [Lentinula raphanica]|nr:hypothetical protein FB446DRAFT_645782 [Lentinula raphanica]
MNIEEEPLDEVVTVYCAGYSKEPLTQAAKAGGAIWYSENNDCNRPIILGSAERKTATTAVVASISAAVSECPPNRVLKCIVLNDQVYENITKKLITWDDKGFTGVKDAPLYRALLSKLRARSASTIISKSNNHDNLCRKKAVALAKDASEMRGPANIGDIAAISDTLLQGVKLSEMTQALAYKTIKEMTLPKSRPATEKTIHKIQHDISKITGNAPSSEILWKTIRNPIISRRTRNFLYIAYHGALRIGHYWKHIPECEDRALCKTCNTEENLEHILLECKRPWRIMIWDIVKDLWLKSEPNTDWQDLTFGTILGCCSIPAPAGQSYIRDPIRDRRYYILILEAMHLIWKLRCEVVIEREGRDLTKEEAYARVTQALNGRLERDQRLMSKKWKVNMIPKAVVLETWSKIIAKNQDLPTDWTGETGVLVGIRPITDYG